MVEAQNVVAWVAAFVALWWLIDWIGMRQEGEPLPLRRAPLRVLGDVLRKLWRNKTFMLALLCLWLIAAAVIGVQGYFLRIATPTPPAAAEAAPQIQRSLTTPDLVPELLTQELPEALPRLVKVPLLGWGTMLFVVLLIAAMIRIIIDPPESIGEETARRLRWPVGLLVAALAGSIAIVAVPREFIDSLGYDGTPPPRTILWTIGTMVLLPALLAPMHALLWRLVLEIARDGVWSFKSSMAAMAESWLPIAVLLLLTTPRVLIAIGPDTGAKPALFTALDVVVIAIPILLVFAPWAVVDQQAGFIAALKRSWRLFRQKPVDVIAFGLRFTLIFAVPGGLVALLEPRSVIEWAWYTPLLGIVRNVLLLLQALVLAGLYVHLSEMLAEDDAYATCPSARMAERLEEQPEDL